MNTTFGLLLSLAPACTALLSLDSKMPAAPRLADATNSRRFMIGSLSLNALLDEKDTRFLRGS
jgi:hypothetical protein